jgi:oxygen-independent coproporphyrinogen-3 oxidase
MGAGAHSFFIGRRMANVDAPNRYVDAVNESYEQKQTEGRAELRQVVGGEVPDQETMRADFMILGLRLMSGISVDEFASRFGVTVDDAFGAALTRHLGLGLLAREGDRIRLTERGMLLANEVFVDLLPDPAD